MEVPDKVMGYGSWIMGNGNFIIDFQIGILTPEVSNVYSMSNHVGFRPHRGRMFISPASVTVIGYGKWVIIIP